MSGLSEDSITAPLWGWEFFLLLWHRPHSTCLTCAKACTSSAHWPSRCPFHLPEERAEGAETSQPIWDAFPLQHRVWQLWGWLRKHLIQSTGRKTRILPEPQGLTQGSRLNPTFSWLCISLWGSLWPFLPCTLGLFPSQSIHTTIQKLLAHPGSHKTQNTSQTPEDLQYHPCFSQVPGSIKAKRAILFLLKINNETPRFTKKTPN